MSFSEVVAVLQALEASASARVFVSSGVDAASSSTAEAAVDSAVSAARDGHRAAAIVSSRELTGAAAALAAAARARAPIVVHAVVPDDSAVGRAEVASALDLGAIVVVTWDVADATSIALAARRTAEDSETPFVHVLDVACGASAKLDDAIARPGWASASGAVGFLGPARASARDASDQDLEAKRGERAFAARVPFALAGALREIGELSGHAVAPLERFQSADADEIVVAMGSAFPGARAAAEELRAVGVRAGAVGVRALRPFFAPELVKLLHRAKAVGVLEPLDVALAPCGPLAAMLKGAFADAITWAPGFPGVGHVPPIVSASLATVGDGAHDEARRLFAEIALRDRARRSVVFGSGNG